MSNHQVTGSQNHQIPGDPAYRPCKIPDVKSKRTRSSPATRPGSPKARRPRAAAIRKLRPGLPPTVARRSSDAARPDPAPPEVAQPRQPPRARRPAQKSISPTDRKVLPASVALPEDTRPAAAAAQAPPALPPVASPTAANVLRLRGEYWDITFGGQSALVEDCRGLRYIAILIRDARPPAGPMHARELVAIATGQAAGPIELEARDDVLDATARRQLMDRLEEIAAERDRAVAVGALERAAALDAEHERIADELARAGRPREGRGGRRTFSHEGEKARKAVGKAITEAIARVAAAPELKPLAGHLLSSVRKGQWLSYNATEDWQIHLPSPLPPR
jgi:hypothetical protein